MAVVVIAAAAVILAYFGPTVQRALNDMPSSSPRPPPAPTGFHQVFDDGFGEATLDRSRWSSYAGRAGPSRTWSSANAAVRRGVLDLDTTHIGGSPAAWSEAGVSNKIALRQTYGSYEIRVKVGAGDDVRSDLLLWPSDGNSNEGYVQFGQLDDSNRRTLSAYYQPAGHRRGISSSTSANLSGWNTIGITWTPGKLQYLLNGQVWRTLGGAGVPTTSMSLEMKTEVPDCPGTPEACVAVPTGATFTTSIDWVEAFAPGVLVPDADEAPERDPSIPGGVAMPTTSPAGWKLDFSDDFAAAGLDGNKWSAYYGHLEGDPAQRWAPSHDVVTGNDELDIRAYRDQEHDDNWVTGGVSSKPGLVQTYGKYLVRFRVSPGAFPYVALLWPADNVSSHEVDFAEDFGGARQEVFATVHDHGVQTQRTITTNMTEWHTLGVEWLPGSLRYTLDGEVWASVTGPAVPSVPMVLDLQTTVWDCHNPAGEACPTATSTGSDMDVAWVVAYSPAAR